MTGIKILLFLGLIFSFSIITIDSFYIKFFRYGDRNHNDELTLEECQGHPNLAFSMECEMFWRRMPTAIKDRKVVTIDEFKDMTIRSGIEIFPENLYGRYYKYNIN